MDWDTQPNMSGEEHVVAVGATVTVLHDKSGVRHTWKIVTEKADAGASEQLTASTPVGQALLGRAEGDAVPVPAGIFTILEIVPPPPKPVPPPRKIPNAPILEFSRGQDQEYTEWARATPGGYVLIYGNGRRGYMIHKADCSHLGLDSDYTLETTPASRPRVCSTSRAVLDLLSNEQTGDAPVGCGTCFG